MPKGEGERGERKVRKESRKQKERRNSPPGRPQQLPRGLTSEGNQAPEDFASGLTSLAQAWKPARGDACLLRSSGAWVLLWAGVWPPPLLRRGCLEDLHFSKMLPPGFPSQLLNCYCSGVSLQPLDCSSQAPLSTGFPRQAHWSGLPFLSPGHLLHWRSWERV